MTAIERSVSPARPLTMIVQDTTNVEAFGFWQWWKIFGTRNAEAGCVKANHLVVTVDAATAKDEDLCMVVAVYGSGDGKTTCPLVRDQPETVYNAQLWTTGREGCIW